MTIVLQFLTEILFKCPQDQDESGSTPSGSAQSSAAEGNSGSSMPGIFSSMLKDTTSEHRTHLFDLNCKICTGTVNMTLA